MSEFKDIEQVPHQNSEIPVHIVTWYISHTFRRIMLAWIKSRGYMIAEDLVSNVTELLRRWV